jgi:3-phosphoshikimate 1-carboxyvinyltransferase
LLRINHSKKNTVSVTPVRRLSGEIELPGDKSIAHRAAIIASLAKGESLIENFPDAEDPLATLRCLSKLGIEYEFIGKTLWLQSKGINFLKESDKPLNAMNSGTTMRLLAGLLSGQSFSTIITGDQSLLERPMRRIIKPLKMMRALISGSHRGTGPLKIRGTKNPLKHIRYELPVASAQVKSAILLAGLYAYGTTTVIESVPTRDHTERMLGLPVKNYGGKKYISIDRSFRFLPVRMTIPGDPSTAAFFIVATLITPESEIVIKNFSLNPTRIAFLSVLERMGAKFSLFNKRNPDGEPIGDIRVFSSALRGCTVAGSQIPLIIDEIPILAIAGSTADSYFEVKDAGELRYKESDRIHSVVTTLRAMGLQVKEQADGFIVRGGKLRGGATVDSFGDHRVAMASVIGGLAADRELTVKNINAVAVSFPGFLKTIQSIIHKN